MAPIDPRTPCVVGVAQRTWHPSEARAPEPLQMWEEVAHAAAVDAGDAALLRRVNDLSVVHCQSWTYDDAPARLAERLGIAPAHQAYSILAGTAAQRMINPAAERFLDGRSDLALVVGGEALHTRARMLAAGDAPAWSHPAANPPPFPIDLDEWFWPTELAHQVLEAWLTFAVFESARRARLGEGQLPYQERCARLLASMTAVAAANPHAWFRLVRTAAEIATPTPENRLVAWPYTKRMVAIMNVDQAAAILLATHERADALGIPRERRVYLRGWAFGRDPIHVAERDDLSRSPAMAAASREALAVAGVGIDDVRHLDLYSCFTSSLHFACDALGIGPADARPLTVTGGLPYAGGPSSNYMGHSIATMVDRLRTDPGEFGLVSGVGMHMTKHVFAVYSTTPGSLPRPDARLQQWLDAVPVRRVRDRGAGQATAAAYTVVHGRDGMPQWALLVCDLPGGDRCYAHVRDPDLLGAMEAEEWVGRAVVLEPGDDGVTRAW
jgi:acetyl-CoA C-acetyltransferase